VGEGTQDSDRTVALNLKRRVAEKGRHSRGGHLCFVRCAFQLLLLLTMQISEWHCHD